MANNTYRHEANRADRLIGLPCGCVMLVKGYELAAAIFNPAYAAQAKYMFGCKGQDDDFKVSRVVDYVVANVYFECQAIQEPNAGGLRWQ